MDIVQVLEDVRRSVLERGTSAYVVGGYLRDVLLCRTTRDLDVVVQANALEEASLLARHMNGRFVVLDAVRGVGRVVLRRGGSKVNVDVTSFGGDILDDLSRRDFTINAIAIPLDLSVNSDWRNQILDPHGGVSDIKRGLVRMVRPDVFKDDPGRLLRTVRLAAVLGFRIEEDTAHAVSCHAHLLSKASGERLREEFLTILESQDARHWIYVLDKLGLLTELIPELDLGRGVSQPAEHYWTVMEHNIETVGAVEQLLERKSGTENFEWKIPWNADVEEHFATVRRDGHNRKTLIKLVGLLHDIAKPETKTLEDNGRIRFLGHAEKGSEMVTKIMNRLRFSSRDNDLVGLMVKHHLRPGQLTQKGAMPTGRAVYRYFRDLGDAAIDVLYLHLADYLAARGPLLGVADWQERVTIIERVLETGLYRHRPVRSLKLIDGHDLMRELGLSPGPEVGRLLEAVCEAQTVGHVTTKWQALNLVRELSEQVLGDVSISVDIEGKEG